jgi:drug/metabolite transporter (DMT)-like permease
MVIAMFERLYQRKMIAVEPIDVSKTGMLLLNNGISILPTTILFLLPIWDPPEYTNFGKFASSNAGDYVMLFLSCVCGVAIGWTAINAQQYVTATTMLVVTNMNKIVVVIYGMFRWPDKEPRDATAILGVSIAITGGIWYALVRKHLGDKAKAAKEAEAAKSAPFLGAK